MNRTVPIAGAALAALAATGWLLLPRSSAARLLWFEGRAVSWSDERAVVLSRAGDLLEVAGSGVLRLQLRTGGRTLLGAAAGAGGGVWLVDDAGTVLRWNEDGSVREIGRTPFDIPALSGGDDGSLWVARSPVHFTYSPESTGAPALVRLDSALTGLGSAGRVTIPRNPFMSQLANAGHVQALPDGGVVFAPFVRDEVVRFGPDGVERWRLVRGFEHATPDPSVQVGGTGGRPALEVDYAPVNLGLAVGPDGMLYVLSTDGPTDRRTDGRSAGAAITASSRLYSVDPERGTVLRTRRFDTALPTIAVDAEGRVRTPDPARILPGSDPGRRARLEPFDLPAISGGRVSFAGIAGKVTLVNFWASWCGPCAEELPALDSLAGAVDTARTRFVALSDDVSDDAARRFVAERDFRNLRFALGSGALRRRYRYFGLPYTVLLDGRGGIIHRWSGYGGPAQIEEIARLIRAELARGPSDLHQH